MLRIELARDLAALPDRDVWIRTPLASGGFRDLPVRSVRHSAAMDRIVLVTELEQDVDLDEPHLVEFRPDGWTIQHPLRCRPNLFACPVNRASEMDRRPREGALGVFTVELDEDGVLQVGDRIG